MSRSARVTSIDILPLLAAALQKFRAEGAGAIDELEIELRRAVEWIHHDRKEFWMQELHRSHEAVNQARLQLQQARIAKRIGDQEAPCSEEKRALEKAKRRVETAQRKSDAVRHWTGVIDQAADDFRRSRTQFAIWLDVDLSRAVAALNQLSESLVTYITMEPKSDSGESVPLTEEAEEKDKTGDSAAPGENAPPAAPSEPSETKEAGS
jgi:hypothetical protein